MCDSNGTEEAVNILVLPSWYPNEVSPLGGIFVQEQAKAYAELNPLDNVIVSKWNDGYCEVTPRKPISLLRALWKSINTKVSDVQIENNFYEFYTPSRIVWSRKLPFGGYNSLYNSFRKTFIRVRKAFGSIDVIHAHVSYPAGYLASRLAKEFNLPLVLTEHMSPFPFDRYLKDGKPIKEISQAFRNANQVIAVSSSLQKKIQSFGLPCHQVIPNFIDDKKFTPVIKRGTKFRFFTLCGISEQKGIDVLIKAISLLAPPLNENLEFFIGGEGVQLGYYKRLAESMGLTNVHWLGQVSRVEAPRLFQAAHAYIMLSRHETFGIVYAEAIATGIPVIATRCGGPEDIINEINGLLVEVDNHEKTRSAIEYIYANYSKFDPQEIRKDFEKRFGKTIFAEKLKQAYRSAIK